MLSPTAGRSRLLAKLSQPSPAHRFNANGHSPHPTIFYLLAWVNSDARSKELNFSRESSSQLRSLNSAVVMGLQGYSHIHEWASSLAMGSRRRADSDAHLRVDISLLRTRDRDANLSVVSTPSHYQLNPITALPR